LKEDWSLEDGGCGAGGIVTEEDIVWEGVGGSGGWVVSQGSGEKRVLSVEKFVLFIDDL
jgi:hypothetical protein